MVSSGIRLGAWDYLKWKHVKPLRNDEGKIVAAKLDVYSGDVEEYYTFVTPEAYEALKEWMDFRASYGERIDEYEAASLIQADDDNTVKECIQAEEHGNVHSTTLKPISLEEGQEFEQTVHELFRIIN
jgi:hypothetical protein